MTEEKHMQFLVTSYEQKIAGLLLILILRAEICIADNDDIDDSNNDKSKFVCICLVTTVFELRKIGWQVEFFDCLVQPKL